MARFPILVLLVLAAVPAAAQLSDDARFRLQQELGRNDAARENARIERERVRVSDPAPATTLRSDPNAAHDRLREQNRLRDDQSRIQADGDRLRAEQQRQERERIFTPPSGQ